MNIVNKISTSRYFQYLLLYISLQIPSLRILYKILPEYCLFVIPIFLLFTALFYLFLFKNKNAFFDRIIDSVVLTLFLMLIIIIANYFLYPIVDARKYLMKGCDQDDAIIAVANALFSGNSPYNVTTYSNPGASTGPGLVILLAPFILGRVYFLITPVMVGILLFFIYKSTKSIRPINFFLLIILSSPIFWELMTNGSDLIAFGILCLIPLYLWKNRNSLVYKIFILIFLSMILTSRIIFIYLAPLYGLFYCKGNLIQWLKYTFTILAIVCFIHFIFYLIDPSVYSPLLLINKGLKLLNIPLIIISILFFIIILYYTALSSIDFLNNLFLLWCWLAIPLFFITIISLDYQDNILNQYPFTYLGPQIPIFLAFFIENKFNYKKTALNVA